MRVTKSFFLSSVFSYIIITVRSRLPVLTLNVKVKDRYIALNAATCVDAPAELVDGILTRKDMMARCSDVILTHPETAYHIPNDFA